MNDKKIISAIILASFIDLGYFFLAHLLSEKGNLNNQFEKHITLSNMMMYIIGVILFLVVFFYLYYFSTHILFIVNRTDYIYFLILLLLSISYFLEDKYTSVSQTNGQFRHLIPSIVYIVIIIGVVRVSSRLLDEVEIRRTKLFRLSTISAFAALTFYLLYMPNPITSGSSSLYHIDAYINSILNVNRLVPYSYDINSIYGHYGIFYLLPVKLFHIFVQTKWEAISLSVALFGCISFLLLCYVISKKVKNDVVFFVSIVCLTTYNTSFLFTNYYQISPHRILFQSITLALCLYIIDNRPKFSLALLTLCGTMSVIWNIEVGIVCVAICSLVVVFLTFKKERIIESIAYFLTFWMLCLSCAWAFVCLYNILCGGDLLSIKDYIYPIMASDYKIVDGLQLKLDIPFSLYYIMLLSFLICIAKGGVSIASQSIDSSQFFDVIVGIMGIGVLTYYINRVCYNNLFIGVPCFIIILARAAGGESVAKDINSAINAESTMNQAIRKACLIMLCFFFIEVVSSINLCLNTLKGQAYNMATLRDFVDGIEIDEEKTQFIGVGSTVLCTIMKDNNMLYTMDWEDIPPISKYKVYDEIENDSNIVYLLAYDGLREEIEERFEGSQLIKEYNTGNNGMTYCYYKIK